LMLQQGSMSIFMYFFLEVSYLILLLVCI
jgi:hypothetical protein